MTWVYPDNCKPCTHFMLGKACGNCHNGNNFKAETFEERGRLLDEAVARGATVNPNSPFYFEGFDPDKIDRHEAAKEPVYGCGHDCRDPDCDGCKVIDWKDAEVEQPEAANVPVNGCETCANHDPIRNEDGPACLSCSDKTTNWTPRPDSGPKTCLTVKVPLPSPILDRAMEYAQSIGKDRDPTAVDNPETNPKEAAGAKKAPIWTNTPRMVLPWVGRVFAAGAAKYGRFNFIDSGVTATTYEDALERHQGLWFDGEDTDPETGCSHLDHAIAGLMILRAAQLNGTLVDNRKKTGLFRKSLDELDAIAKAIPLPAKFVG